MRKFKIGTRGSALALWQANFVTDNLKVLNPDCVFEITIIQTGGDRDQKSSLTQIGGQGVFTKTIEDALLNNEIDIAVHSLKDLPSMMAQGLKLGAVPERGPVEDVFIGRSVRCISELPHGAKIATGSIRRRCQLLRKRPDLQMVDLRGNINTRLEKLHSEEFDGIIMARAALVRLGMDEVEYETLPVETMIPAVGQGAVGVQIRGNDSAVGEVVTKLNDENTFLAVTAERACLAKLDSGCRFPVGALARVESETLTITGMVGSFDGRSFLKEQVRSKKTEAEKAGVLLAEKLIAKGAL